MNSPETEIFPESDNAAAFSDVTETTGTETVDTTSVQITSDNAASVPDNNSTYTDSLILDEIAHVSSLLEHYGFSFMELPACSPRTNGARHAVADAVAVLIENPAFFSMLRSNRELPLKELVKYSGAPRKTLEQHRRYIIAAAEILNGKYPLLQEYMVYIDKAIKR